MAGLCGGRDGGWRFLGVLPAVAIPVTVRAGIRAVLFVRTAHPAPKLPGEHFPGVTEFGMRAENGRGLIADVHHAIFAARVAAAPVLLPRRVRKELFECGVV